MATFSVADARRGSSTLLVWVLYRLEPEGGGATVNYKWSHVSIPDINAGMIQGRVTQWSTFIRALSDRQGRYEGSRFGWTLADFDRQILSLMDSATQRYMHQRIATVHMITDAERRTGVTPLVIARGVVREVQPTNRRQLAFQAEDFLSSEFSTSNDDEELPRRRVSPLFFADAPAAVIGLPEPQIYGELDEPGPEFHGLVPCIPVGTEVISATTWYRFLIAGHACKEIRALYINGVQWSGVGVDFLVPGYAGWPHANTYVDITAGSETRRYTLIYARGPIGDNAVNGTAPLTANVYGVEDNGNGSGTLLTNILDQYRHWFINFKIQNYLSGSWLANPQFHPILDTTLRLSETAFTAAKTAHNTRFPGGYEGAGILGCNGDIRPTSDWIQAWNLSSDVASGFDRDGAFMVAVRDVSTSVASFKQSSDLIEDSFNGAPPMFDQMRNILPYNYRRRWAGGSWDKQDAKVKSTTSIDGYQIEKPDSSVDLWFIIDSATAENLMASRLHRLHHPPRTPRFDTGAYAQSLVDIGKTITLTHGDAPGGATGWSARNIFVERLETAPNRGIVSIEGFDLDAIGTLSYTTEAGYAGQASGGGLTFGVVTSPVVTVAVATSGPRALGGDRSRPQTGNTAKPVIDYRVVEIDWSTIPTFNVRCDIESKTSNASNPVDIELVRVDASDVYVSTAVSFTQHSNTVWTKQSSVLPTGSGVERYLLRHWCTNSAGINTYALGELKLIPI